MWIFSQSCACVCVCIGAEYAGLCVVHWFLTVSPFHYEREMEKNHDEFRHREHVKSTQTIIFGTILPVRECISVVHTSRVRCINRSFHPKFSVIRYEGKREREEERPRTSMSSAATSTEYKNGILQPLQCKRTIPIVFVFFISVFFSLCNSFVVFFFWFCLFHLVCCRCYCLLYFLFPLCARVSHVIYVRIAYILHTLGTVALSHRIQIHIVWVCLE